ncbi:hypothetical protein MON38_04460 [Hymenobacter sp. DH14]|uniref:Uncharacterized protein n=1 Tax=Hymenobacter cyanobacteriorum TaxID=2926463 RepID=A0A9X1VCJ6_9BACT|nr:hypothetical protein [Hymenobacter cyanobacteriorum]MCI1186659.1 hypothetical protein [Hymenobacter cyanobacteriorum]
MRLIAFRPEYQITAEPSRNRIFYKHFAELAQAQELPEYLSDWQQALDAMKPGFTILSDMTELDDVSGPLAKLFEQAQTLLDGRGLRMIATVHAPDVALAHAATSAEAPAKYPRRSFTDLWQADKFLDELAAGA